MNKNMNKLWMNWGRIVAALVIGLAATAASGLITNQGTAGTSQSGIISCPLAGCSKELFITEERGWPLPYVKTYDTDPANKKTSREWDVPALLLNLFIFSVLAFVVMAGTTTVRHKTAPRTKGRTQKTTARPRAKKKSVKGSKKK